MTPAEHLASFFTAWMRYDAHQMAEFYADDAVMEDPTLSGQRTGRKEIERYYRDMFAALEYPEHRLLDWAARGERVWFEWSFASGGRLTPRAAYTGVSIQTIRDGLITHDAAFWQPDA